MALLDHIDLDDDWILIGSVSAFPGARANAAEIRMVPFHEPAQLMAGIAICYGPLNLMEHEPSDRIPTTPVRLRPNGLAALVYRHDKNRKN